MQEDIAYLWEKEVCFPLMFSLIKVIVLFLLNEYEAYKNHLNLQFVEINFSK